jgi:DnaJ-class molecular chaperone
MKLDYYTVLGLTAKATQEDIAKAYRKKALIHHPDKGGSHLEMIKINEAYEILKDPITRATYDKARNENATTETVYQDSQNRRKAQSNAVNYPKHWEDFEKWLRNDFKKADYMPNASIGQGRQKINIPTGGDSVSAQTFIWGGGIIGALLALSLVGFPLKKGEVALYTLLIGGGAWAGAGIHRNISDGL